MHLNFPLFLKPKEILISRISFRHYARSAFNTKLCYTEQHTLYEITELFPIVE
jgi:hypothetical protein